MKKLMIVIASIIFSVSAYSQDMSADPVKEIQFAISEQVKFPQSLKQSDFNESVGATVKLLPDGQLEVVSIETNHPSLRQYVEESIERIRIPGDMVYRAITLTLNFNFKVL